MTWTEGKSSMPGALPRMSSFTQCTTSSSVIKSLRSSHSLARDIIKDYLMFSRLGPKHFLSFYIIIYYVFKIFFQIVNEYNALMFSSGLCLVYYEAKDTDIIALEKPARVRVSSTYSCITRITTSFL